MIDSDPSLEVRLEYATDHGMPLSQFDSWPELDQGLALALLRKRRRRCPGCGLTQEDLKDPAHPPFIADVHICQGCLELARVENQVDEKQKRGARMFWVPADQYVPPDERGEG